MESYKDYIESNEKDEEKIGKDLDHDGEKGESWDHARKAFKNDLKGFIKTRMKGAEKIANNAKADKGVATLTYWHFHKKVETYRKALHMKENQFEARFREVLSKVKIKNLSPQQFQEILGELEVWGELISR